MFIYIFFYYNNKKGEKMIKNIMQFLAISILISCCISMPVKANNSGNTKYPIVLVHGLPATGKGMVMSVDTAIPSLAISPIPHPAGKAVLLSFISQIIFRLADFLR